MTDKLMCQRCEQVEVVDYEPHYCCTGWECGCMGLPVEPPLCDACWDIVSTPRAERQVQNIAKEAAQ